MNFKVGNKVRMKSKSVPGWEENWGDSCPNLIGWITKIYGDGSGRNSENCLVVDDVKDSDTGNFFTPRDLELIPSNEKQEHSLKNIKLITSSEPIRTEAKSKMRKITSKIRRIFNPDLQEQYKAGYIDDCGDMTESGLDELREIQRDFFNDKLTEVAKKANEEERKEKK